MLPELSPRILPLSPRINNNTNNLQKRNEIRQNRASFSPRRPHVKTNNNNSVNSNSLRGSMFTRKSVDELPTLRSTTAPNNNNNSQESLNNNNKILNTNPQKWGARKTVEKTIVNVSNPISIKNTRVYKYKYYPGNNGRVILNALRKRPWWRSSGNKTNNNLNSNNSIVGSGLQGYNKDGTKKGNSNRNNKSIKNSKDKKSVREINKDNSNNKNKPSTPVENIDYDFVWEMYRNPMRYKNKKFVNVVLNHIEHNACLVSKKGLYLCLKSFCTGKTVEDDGDDENGDRMEGEIEIQSEPVTKIDNNNNNVKLTDLVPQTFLLPAGDPDDFEGRSKEEFKAFCEYDTARTEELSLTYSLLSPSSNNSTFDCSKGVVWILKPASYANRGFGIKIMQGKDEVIKLLRDGGSNSKPNSASSTSSRPSSQASTSSAILSKAAKRCATKNGWICQEYMLNPLLVSGRKFDIRIFVIVTMNCKKKDNQLNAYLFRDGYIRTSCSKYSLNDLSNRECHLTNDAIQKKAKNYGKFESGNKLSFEEWQDQISRDYKDAPSNVVNAKIRPAIKDLCSISIQAAAAKLKKSTINRSFEVLGYDFMVDSNYIPTLIEINSNPCLDFSSPLLEELITNMIDNTFRVGLDENFLPPNESSRTKATAEACNVLAAEENMLEQIYP